LQRDRVVKTLRLLAAYWLGDGVRGCWRQIDGAIEGASEISDSESADDDCEALLRGG
jgi:hypothetical protein